MKNAICIVLMGVLLVGSPAAAQEPDHETTEIVEGVYEFRWQTHNSFFVVTPEGVVAFDPISMEAAERYAGEIRRHMEGGGLRALVYSHHHADHATGAPALFGGLNEAPILAHENAHAPLAERADPDLPPPDVTFTERMVLRLGGRTLELHYLGEGHGDDVIVAYLPEERVVFAVDFVQHDMVGFRDLAGTRYPELLEAMERLQALDYERIVFGHGPPGDRQAVERQIRYYRDLEEAVSEAIDAGLTEEEAVREVELPAYRDWRGYDDWFHMNVRRMYRWLTDTE